MMLSLRQSRRAFTLLELVCVMMALIILGAILIPNLTGMRGDTRTKAGADVLQTYIAKARAKAIEDGIPYRLALHVDGKRVRIAPDTYESLGEMPATNREDSESSSPLLICESDLPEGVIAAMTLGDDDFVAQDQSGWRRVATFLPDGTCREDRVELKVSEEGVSPVLIHLRGLTGTRTTSRGGSSP